MQQPQHLTEQGRIASIREPVPGPGEDTGAIRTTHTANQPSQHGNIDNNCDGTVHSPGAGNSQSINSPPVNGEQRACGHSISSDSGPPPTATQHYEGGGHSVKRVSTDTLHPPTTKRRVTGKRGS